MKVSEITEILDKWMPRSIAEDFDNVGLLIGDSNSEVKNILVTLDTTSNVIDEALDKNCNLIISYHPIIFNDLKKKIIYFFWCWVFFVPFRPMMAPD